MTHDPTGQPIWDAEKMRWVRGPEQTTGIKQGESEPVKLGFAQFDYLFLPLVLAISLTFAIVYPVVSLDRGGVIPDILVGTWKTMTPEYASREFRISKSALVFQNGGDKDSVTAHRIQKVESVVSGKHLLYTITYTASLTDLQSSYEFSFLHENPGSIIRFKNQPHIIWRKQEKKEEKEATPSES